MNPGQARELKKAFTVPNSELMDRRIYDIISPKSYYTLQLHLSLSTQFR